MKRRDPILLRFAETCARWPDRPLVVGGSVAWTAVELDRAADRIARRLRSQADFEGRLVGLGAAGPAFLAGYLALRRLGAVPVLLDGSRPTPDRLAILDRLGARSMLACEAPWPRSAEEWVFERRSKAPGGARNPDWGAIKLTSGSTGEPRGIAVRADALVADDEQLAATMGLVAADRLVAAVPLSHSYGFSSLLLPTLTRGCALLVPDGRSPLAPLAAARDLGGTLLPTVPAWLGAYVRLGSPPPWPESLRLVISAGAPLAPEVAVAFRERTGQSVRVFYGASECGGICFDRIGDAAERGTVGTPVDGVALELDPGSGRLTVSSPAVAESFLPEPVGDLGGGRFRTGDRAAFEGEELRLLGRVDDLVIVRGRNVDPREVERALAELPGVEEACVLGVDGPDGPRSVLRAVVVAPGGDLDYERIVSFCRDRLAAHKVPRSVVVVDELPRTERGKLDRAALAALTG